MHPFAIHNNEEDIKYDNIITTNIDINDNNECVITINTLNVHLFDDNEECVICTYDLLDFDVVNTSCCKQKIHKKCIVECFRNSGSCPLCRAKYILKQNLEVTYENYEMKSEIDKKNIISSHSLQTSSSTPNNNDEECISCCFDISITCMCKYIVPMIFCCFIITMLVIVGVIPLFHYSNHDRNCLDNYSNCTYNKNNTNLTHLTNLKNLTKY